MENIETTTTAPNYTELSTHHSFSEPGTYSITLRTQNVSTEEFFILKVFELQVVHHHHAHKYYSDSPFNPIIPIVVSVCLLVYVILLILAMYIQWYGDKHRYSLIVSVDVNRFDEETFYLLTLETGNQPFAGTSANICCCLYGEHGRSKVS